MMNMPKNEWMDQWQAMSRQYWNAWQDLSREAGASAGKDPASTPWHEGFEQWSRMFAGAGKQGDTIERVLASAKSFTAFMQSMLAAATAGGTATNFADALRNGLDMPGVAGAFTNPLATALREITGQGAKGVQQMMEQFAPGGDPYAEIKGWLRVPAFGFLREHQEHYQKMAAALVDYQEQNGRYNALILKSSQRAFEKFESKLAAREEPGRQIDSLRALYDLWVDAAEESYAEIALSPEFREVYGALVNAQMRVRSQMQQEVERIATDLGMPTRSELDSIGQRLHDLRREMRSGGRSEASGDLAREVDRLRREVAALKSAVNARPQKSREAAPTRPAAAPARTPRHQRARPVAKKRPPAAVALRADEESVSTAPVAAKSPPPAKKSAARAKSRAQRRAAPKKSVAKVAHSPTRVGHPVPSFAQRMHAFADAARKHSASRRNGGR